MAASDGSAVLGSILGFYVRFLLFLQPDLLRVVGCLPCRTERSVAFGARWAGVRQASGEETAESCEAARGSDQGLWGFEGALTDPAAGAR